MAMLLDAGLPQLAQNAAATARREPHLLQKAAAVGTVMLAGAFEAAEGRCSGNTGLRGGLEDEEGRRSGAGADKGIGAAPGTTVAALLRRAGAGVRTTMAAGSAAGEGAVDDTVTWIAGSGVGATGSPFAASD